MNLRLFSLETPITQSGLRNWWGLSAWLSRKGRPRAAAQGYRQSLFCYRQLNQRFPAVLEHQRQEADVATELGYCLSIAGQPREAAQVYRQAIDGYQKLSLRLPCETKYRRELAGSYFRMGRALWAGGDLQAAEKAIRQYADLCRSLAENCPADLDLCEERAHSLRWLAMLVETARPNEAGQYYRQTVRLLEELTGLCSGPGEDSPLVGGFIPSTRELSANAYLPAEAEAP